MSHPNPLLDKHFCPGIYIHYKGGKYRALTLAETHNHNGDIDVVYLSLEHGAFRTRPFRRDSRNEDSWTDVLIWPDGEMRERFVLESEYEPEPELPDLSVGDTLPGT